jgi:hypothetical protein
MQLMESEKKNILQSRGVQKVLYRRPDHIKPHAPSSLLSSYLYFEIEAIFNVRISPH